MLEILFTESAAGGLKYAKNYGKGPYKSKTVRFVPIADGKQLSRQEMDEYRKAVEEKERINWEKATPMDIGTVVSLPFAMATGDISEDYPAEKRKEYFVKLMSIYPEFHRKENADKWFSDIQHSLDTVIEAAKTNQPLRIWYSDNPDELCGLYHLVYLIYKITPDCEIYTVKLPNDYVKEDGTIINYNGWGGVPPEEWHMHFRPQPMTKPFRTLCITNWHRLKADNAPVRALLNGIVQSLPRDIYDSFILKEIQQMDTQFRQALVIGRVLGKYQLCVGDAFIAHRMETMIENGMLTVIQPAADDMPLYHRILQKNI